MTTARQIITKSMQKAGILTKSQTPDDDEVDDALDALNGMLSSWSNDSLLVYARTWETFTLSGGVASYTIGSGGDLDTVRPIYIAEAYLRSGTIDYPLSIITDEVYNNDITDKAISGVSEFLNYDNAFPLGKIRLYPVPSVAYQLFLLTEKPLVTLTADTVISLPPGWERALVYNLALEILPDYGQEPTQTLIKIANDSMASIKRASARTRSMDSTPFGQLGGFNVYRGY